MSGSVITEEEGEVRSKEVNGGRRFQTEPRSSSRKRKCQERRRKMCQN